MNINKKYFSKLTAAILFAAVLFSDSKINASDHFFNSLELTISLNAYKFKVNDAFIVTLKLKNLKRKPIGILGYLSGYRTQHLKINDSRNDPIERVNLSELLLGLKSTKNIVSLQSGEEINYSIEGKILKDKVENYQGKKQRQIMISFGRSAFILRGPGKYKIRGYWRASLSDFIPEEHQKLPKNMWLGDISSNEVEFEFVK